jgi:hypothetical protein
MTLEPRSLAGMTLEPKFANLVKIRNHLQSSFFCLLCVGVIQLFLFVIDDGKK